MKTSNKLLLSALVLVLVFITVTMIAVRLYLKPKDASGTAEPTSSVVMPAQPLVQQTNHNSFTWIHQLQVKEADQEENEISNRRLTISVFSPAINFFSVMTMFRHE